MSYPVVIKKRNAFSKPRDIVIRLDALAFALEFLVTFTRCKSGEELFGTSENSFRVLYLIALVFRELMIMEAEKPMGTGVRRLRR